ncbi:hypothetical protein TFLX_04878 [Thermoflexales bacterium]|nr:hypothetical protein TFLX_04878 [Thermoflexales bacterium]
MKHHKPFLPSLAFMLFVALLAACNMPGASPTSTQTPTAEATLEPTALPTAVPIIITPIPLPTTVPNQVELIKKATRNHPGDFVIDTQQLKGGVVPWWFRSLDNWYKYTSPDGAFSVLMHGGVAPKETTLDDQQGAFLPGTKVVEANYLMTENQKVIYFESPVLAAGTLSPEQFLQSFEFDQLAPATYEVKIVRDERLQLGEFPGRDVLLQYIPLDQPEKKTEIHIRLYIVENTFYQLLYGGFGKSTQETEARFLNSFTVHDAAP